jgi:hypothetical protein
MKTFATIRENDETTGAIIEVGYVPFTDEEENTGFQVAASNGDDVGYFRAQAAEKCEADIVAMWGRWATYEEI